MTAPTTRETADHAELLERLKRVKYVREAHDEPYGTYDQPCDADDYGAEAIPVNPDGEAAANALENLLSEIAALRVRAEEADALASKHFVALREKQDDAAILKHGKLEAERQRDELRKALEDHDQTAAECRIDGARPQRDTTAPCELCGATQRESCGRKGSAAYAFISSARTLLANQGADQ